MSKETLTNNCNVDTNRTTLPERMLTNPPADWWKNDIEMLDQYINVPVKKVYPWQEGYDKYLSPENPMNKPLVFENSCILNRNNCISKEDLLRLTIPPFDPTYALNKYCMDKPGIGNIAEPQDPNVVIKELIDAGADINNINIEDTTPLTRAVINNNVEMVQILLYHGANINRLNRNHKNLANIVMENNIDLSKVMIEVLEQAYKKQKQE